MNDGWKPLKEPKSLTNAMLLSMPFMVINALLSFGIIYFFSSFSIKQFTFFTGDSIIITIDIGLIIVLLSVLIVHEFFHLIFIPNFLKSKDIIIGLTFLAAFVHTEQTLTKARYILILVAPFLILSILFPLILCISGLLTGKVLFFIILNSLGSSLDIMGLFLVLFQVPNKALLRNNGTRTYWKLES